MGDIGQAMQRWATDVTTKESAWGNKEDHELVHRLVSADLFVPKMRTYLEVRL